MKTIPHPGGIVENISIFYYQANVCSLTLHATDKGVIHVRFGKSKSLDRGFDFSPITRQLDEYFAGRLKKFDIPLVYDRTSFAGRVLTALSKVPYGATISYSRLSEKAGFPNACRAVGNVMADNPFPIFIPCHRVIKADGRLGCFGGGGGLKRRLLEMEGGRV